MACDEATWKIRVQKRWRGLYPPVQHDEHFPWTRACIGELSFLRIFAVLLLTKVCEWVLHDGCV